MLRSVLATLAALSFVGIGLGAAIAPEALSDNYGIPIDDDTGRAYIRALGARDAILGILIAGFLASRNHRALSTTLGVCAIAGLTDFSLVLAARGASAPNSLAIHATGTFGLLYIASLFGADGDEDVSAGPTVTD